MGFIVKLLVLGALIFGGLKMFAPELLESLLEKKSEKVIDLRCKIENELAPTWICDPSSSGGFVGLGVAKKSKAGMGFMNKIALLNARRNLAQQIKVTAKSKLLNYFRSIGTDENLIEILIKNTMRKLNSLTLTGSKAKERWTSSSGSLYMLVEAPPSNINAEIKKAIKFVLTKDRQLYQQMQSQAALSDLDKEFE